MAPKKQITGYSRHKITPLTKIRPESKKVRQNTNFRKTGFKKNLNAKVKKKGSIDRSQIYSILKKKIRLKKNVNPFALKSFLAIEAFSPEYVRIDQNISPKNFYKFHVSIQFW